MIKDIIPWAISAISLVFVIVTFIKNSKKDDHAEMEKTYLRFDALSESLLKVNIKLDQVCATTNETRSDIKAMNGKISELDKEIEVMKRDIKTCFNKIDEMRRVNL